MASQNILETASASTLSLTTSGSININVGGFLGWGFDVNLTSTEATGNLYIYTQYTDPVGDTFVDTTPTAYAVASGTFANAVTRLTIDSNNVTTQKWVIISWQGTDASNGNIAIVGLANIF